MKILYNVQKALFRFIGDIKWHGIWHPFWFTINAKTFQLKGSHYRIVEQLIQPGDIIIRRFEGYVDKWFIPGWFNHAGIYVGDINEQKHKIVHSISDGVVIDDLIDFMRTDHMIVLRAPAEMVKDALQKAESIVGLEYDFAFDFKGHKKFSCTEVVDYCYPNMIIPKKRFGKTTIVADDIIASPKLSVVWDSRKNNK